ncbi:MAG: NAD(P)/FAD-dependent oxidoreductase, partial [Calditrichaeota bacterium]
MSYDALIIGAGHNGLVAAALLAKAGLRVLVCERRETPGGLAAAEALFPGFRVNLGADDAGLLLPEVIRELRLTARGVDFYQPPAAALALHSEGQSLTLWRDAARTAETLARHSSADARRFPDFVEQTARFAGLIRQAGRLTPPPLKEASLQEGWPWLRLGTRIRGLGRREMMEFLRILPLPVGEYLEEWFETPLLKAALAAPAILGNPPGPMAAGTTLMMLYHQMGGANGGFKSVRFVKGGMGTLIRALETALREHGGEIRTGCPVNRIRVEDGRAVGVELGDGEVISARAVLSTADPSRTFLHLVGAPALEPRFVRKVRNIRFRGVTARMILALDGLPAFPESITEAELTGYILVCPDLLYMERAADDAKYGRISRHPCLWMTIPTLSDPSLAPPGKHLLNITMQYAPY